MTGAASFFKEKNGSQLTRIFEQPALPCSAAYPVLDAMDHLLHGVQHGLLARQVSLWRHAGRVAHGSGAVHAIGYGVLLFHHLLFNTEIPLQRPLYTNGVFVDAVHDIVHTGLPVV